MPLSIEVFIMLIFIAGFFFYYSLWNSGFPGDRYFFSSYVFLTLSNIFAVIEEYWLNTFFNICEHLSITLASIMILAAVITLTKSSGTKDKSRIIDTSKG